MSCRFLLTFLPVLAVFAGCAIDNASAPPASMADYVRLSQSGRLNCSNRCLLAFNAQRVADDQLSDTQRLDSLGVVQELYDGDPNIRAGLSGAADDPDTGTELKDAIHMFLMAHPPGRTGSYAQDTPARAGATIR